MNGLPEKQMSEDVQSVDHSIGTPYREIKLTQGKVAIVDAEDFKELNKFKWSAFKGRNVFYAQRNVWAHGKGKVIFMHRQILNPPDGLETDHINRNGLDNRKMNLRSVTRSENAYNAKLENRNISGYKGVRFDKQRKRWMARCGGHSSMKFLGRFKTLEEAVAARAKYVEKMGLIT